MVTERARPRRFGGPQSSRSFRGSRAYCPMVKISNGVHVRNLKCARFSKVAAVVAVVVVAILERDSRSS